MDSWVEKYKPKSLDDIIMGDELKEMFRGYLEKNTICSMTLAGTAGIGKTTTANIITEQIPNCNVRYINASDENGIDVVRTKIKDFVEMAPFENGLKVLILDEADGLTKDSQKCLRSLMESDMEDTRFILTCNNPTNIIEPIYSRCPLVDISYNISEVIKRAGKVLKQEGVDVVKNQNQIIDIVKKHFPDIRTILNVLERSFITGDYVDIDDMTIKGADEVIDFILENIQDHAKCRKYWKDNSGKFNNNYDKLGVSLLHRFTDDINVMSILGDKYYQLNIVTDKEIGFFLMVIALKGLEISKQKG